MNVDFLHNQIIRDTISPKFIESFNENLLPSLCLKYGESLQVVQFYEDHLADGFRISGVFYYPLTLVVSGVAKTQWISWPVANYRHYDNMNPYTYKGQDFLEFKILDRAPAELEGKIEQRPVYSHGGSLPMILSAATDDKTFLSGKYSQSFIDLLASQITEAVESELAISGLAGSGVVLEMRFMPGTFMEHIVKNTTYRRLLIKARACSARDLWVKWTRLDKNGTYTISDNVDRSMIRVELAEDVPGKIKETEYRYLTSESIEKYQSAMGRKNITEWREMMRRVIRRGEVEKFERIKITKPRFDEEAIEEEERIEAESAPVYAEVASVTIPSSAERERDELTERLNALLSRSEPATAIESEQDEAVNNSDINDLLRGALGAAVPDMAGEEPEAIEEPATDLEEQPVEEDLPSAEPIAEEAEEEAPFIISAIPLGGKRRSPDTAIQNPLVDESEIEARIRRELEEKMRAEMEELRKKNEEAEELRARLEAQKRAEAREKELLAEAARQAVLDKEKREADLRAEAERDRIEAERRAEEEARAAEKRRKEEEAKREQERIEAELEAAKNTAEPAEILKAVPAPTKYITKTVTLIFRRGGVDKAMTKRVHEIIIATIKYLHKEDVFMRIKANIPDPTTLNLTFSELPESEQQLIVDIIQVLGKSNIGITKAILE